MFIHGGVCHNTIHHPSPDAWLPPEDPDVKSWCADSQLSAGQERWDSTENDITAAAVPLREAVKIEK